MSRHENTIERLKKSGLRYVLADGLSYVVYFWSGRRLFRETRTDAGVPSGNGRKIRGGKILEQDEKLPSRGLSKV